MKLSGFRSWHFCQVAADTEYVRLLTVRVALLDLNRTVFLIRARSRACRSLFVLARRARSGYFCK